MSRIHGSRRAFLALGSGTLVALVGRRVAACPPPATMLAKLTAEAVATRKAFASTNISSASPHKANDSQTALWHQNEEAIEALQVRLWAKYTDKDGNFPTAAERDKCGHEFMLGIALIVKSNRIAGRYAGNCIQISAVMYAEFYAKYSGIEIFVFNKVKSALTSITRHAFLVVKCGKDYYIVDGWKDGGVAYGPLVYDATRKYFVDPTTKEAPTPYYAEELEYLAGPTATKGTTTL
jgi:hypothetical protein